MAYTSLTNISMEISVDYWKTINTLITQLMVFGVYTSLFCLGDSIFHSLVWETDLRSSVSSV